MVYIFSVQKESNSIQFELKTIKKDKEMADNMQLVYFSEDTKEFMRKLYKSLLERKNGYMQ